MVWSLCLCCRRLDLCRYFVVLCFVRWFECVFMLEIMI